MTSADEIGSEIRSGDVSLGTGLLRGGDRGGVRSSLSADEENSTWTVVANTNPLVSALLAAAQLPGPARAIRSRRRACARNDAHATSHDTGRELASSRLEALRTSAEFVTGAGPPTAARRHRIQPCRHHRQPRVPGQRDRVQIPRPMTVAPTK